MAMSATMVFRQNACRGMQVNMPKHTHLKSHSNASLHFACDKNKTDSLKIALSNFPTTKLNTHCVKKLSSPKRLHLTKAIIEHPRKGIDHSGSSLETKFEDVTAGNTRGNTWNTVPDMWTSLAETCGNEVALFDPHKPGQISLTYNDVHLAIKQFGEGLRVLGVSQNDCVSIFSENSHRWIVADQGIMVIGAHNAVRGAKAPADELMTIAKHSESVALVLESEELLEKLSLAIHEDKELLSRFKLCILLWSSDAAKKAKDSQIEISFPSSRQFNLPFPVYTYEEVIDTGATSIKAIEATRKAGEQWGPVVHPSDLATIVYTSGTSGRPKGVMLTHANLMHQVNNFGSIISPCEGEVVLSLLPPWHMYERSTEYFVLSKGAKIIYSSVKTFKEDLTVYPPDFFVAVPLVFETLFNAVQKKLSSASAARAAIARSLIAASMKFFQSLRIIQGNDLEGFKSKSNVFSRAIMFVASIFTLVAMLPFHLLAKKLVYKKIRDALGIRKLAVSGGGSLPSHVDRFFEAIGITLLNGYGLTETSPVLTARTPVKNVLGTVGVPLPGTEVRVVDSETGAILPVGKKGVVTVRGPQVMKGYFKDPNATSKVIDNEGFFNTGDLGWVTPNVHFGSSRNCAGLLVLDGRLKDTIVLANGENVEPAAIEEIVLQSSYVNQVIVVGQDKRKLGALIVPHRDVLQLRVDALKKVKGSQWEPRSEDIEDIVKHDIALCLKRSGIPQFQFIGPIAILEEPFTVENGMLTPTMKMKRERITDKYEQEISLLYL